MTQPAAFSKDAAAPSSPKAGASGPKAQRATSSKAEPLLPYPDAARTAPAPGNWTAVASSASSSLNGSKAGAGAKVASPPAPEPVAAPAAEVSGAAKGKGKDGGAAADAAAWGDGPQPASDWDGSAPAKPSALGEALLGQQLHAGLLLSHAQDPTQRDCDACRVRTDGGHAAAGAAHHLLAVQGRGWVPPGLIASSTVHIGVNAPPNAVGHHHCTVLAERLTPSMCACRLPAQPAASEGAAAGGCGGAGTGQGWRPGERCAEGCSLRCRPYSAGSRDECGLRQRCGRVSARFIEAALCTPD